MEGDEPWEKEDNKSSHRKNNIFLSENMRKKPML
jgi:hypothetical protein